MTATNPVLSAPRVFVVNEPTLRDGSKVLDISPAAAYGELVHVLRPGHPPVDGDEDVDTLRDGLQSFAESDYLLLVGDVIAIGCAVALAADFSGGSVNLLRWQNRRQRYEVVRVRLWESADEEAAPPGAAS